MTGELQAFRKDIAGIPEPLRRGTFDEFVNEDGVTEEPEEPDYNLKYLYDGGCSVCMSLVSSSSSTLSR